MKLLFLIMLFSTPFLALMWVFGYFHDAADRANTRKNFSRPSFRAWADKDGLHIESGEDLDHATRCQNFLKDDYETKRRLSSLPWIWFAALIVVGLLA